MRHPLEAVPSNRRASTFWPLFFATVLIMAIMQWASTPLKTSAAPSGIISYELAGSVAAAEQILASWDQTAREYAAFGLGFDYLFMLVYSTTIALACIWAGDVLKSRRWPLAGLGIPLAWGQWLAALLDAIENLALTRMFLGGVASPWPELARFCALVKFLLILVGILYALFGLLSSLVRRPATQV